MTSAAAKRIVLFHRNFLAFTGGHLKIWDYFSHVAARPDYAARIAFTPESKWDGTNPWFRSREAVVPWEPDKADILFLAGTDWRVVPAAQRASSPGPIINLIQHPRHAEKGSELRGFLKHRAIRICVSEEVADAIKATAEVNGPIFVIPNGIDLSAVPPGKEFAARSTDLLICGLKAPELARRAYTQWADQKRNVRWLIEWIPRREYLTRLTDARITLFLPRPSEGFYLPALEGMATGTVVICPDCLGNQTFCVDGVNCFRPVYDGDRIFAAVEQALQQNENDRKAMQTRARETLQAHSLEQERASFFSILDRVEELWRA